MKTDINKAEAQLVQKLDDLGLKRLVFHKRFEDDPLTLVNTKVIAETRVYIVSKEHKYVEGEVITARGFGVAQCSYKDQFSRKKGRLTATARAIKEMEAADDKGYSPRKGSREA